ncbi:hypothetical protein NAT51_08735 [Flavobacterium amniphilum]|uniref:hypothetical protein n=1 Tax=Flavobacterium amniphilum TaxID=1834035 RepID=UPI00202A9456|nr:hypothetical protein [Flavobacterium amniphilum]MCL9805606.1 hypothetical protein [Flavobacterium amniphilum]
MESKNAPVYLFIVASFLALIATIIDNEWLMILSKPMIIPSLFTYYSISDKKETSFELLAILLIYFISDAITLIHMEDSTLYMMVLDYIPYILLLKVVIQDAVRSGFCKNKFSLGIILFGILMLAMYFLLQSLMSQDSDFVFPIISYGIILGLYVTVSSYNYFKTGFSDAASFIFVASVFGLIADVIFVITNMVFNVKALTYIEFAFQIISYFYIVAYFVNRDKMHLSTELI